MRFNRMKLFERLLWVECPNVNIQFEIRTSRGKMVWPPISCNVDKWGARRMLISYGLRAKDVDGAVGIWLPLKVYLSDNKFDQFIGSLALKLWTRILFHWKNTIYLCCCKLSLNKLESLPICFEYAITGHFFILSYYSLHVIM